MGGGVIVNDIGAAGEKFDANYICGSAGNAALMAFTRALGGKSLADNIRVVGINPGPVGTDRHVTLLKTRAKHQFGDENRYKEFQKGMPLGRPAHAREIGDLMAFLASDRAGYTSGVIYTVDGGIRRAGVRPCTHKTGRVIQRRLHPLRPYSEQVRAAAQFVAMGQKRGLAKTVYANGSADSFASSLVAPINTLG